MHLFLIALLATLLVSPPAQAEIDFRKDPDARADLALIEGCMEKAESWEAVRKCTGVTYEACAGRIGRKVSHAAQSDCLFRELGLWLHLQSLEEAKIEAWTILKDSEIRASGSGGPRAHEAFLRLERTWNTYREKQCSLEMLPITSGNARMTDEPYCNIRIISERFWQLKAMADLQISGVEP